MIELVMAGMMSCALIQNTINDAGDRDCMYRCQDKTLVKVSTNAMYQCPTTIYEKMPKKMRNY